MSLHISIVDYLPYIDNHEVSAESEAEIRRQIDNELTKIDTKTIHSLVSQNYPEIKQNKNVQVSNNKLDTKYTTFVNEQGEMDIDKLKLLASYSIQRELNLQIYQDNKNLIANEWDYYNLELESFNKGLSDEINTKKRKIEELNIERKAKSQQFKPMNDYLNERWNEKIEELIDVGIEFSKKELERMGEDVEEI